MLYRRESYKLLPKQTATFTTFFKDYILPYQIKNGAKLVGMWITQDNDQYMAMWEYTDYEEYLKIEKRNRKDELYQLAEEKRQCLGEFFLDGNQDFLESTGIYSPPRHSVSVSGFITNKNQEALLVKTFWRPDTWELPGGTVDEGETLDQALVREILEETGIHVKLFGVTGVYSNGSTVALVFCGEAIGGKLTTSNETQDVQFTKLDPMNLSEYITRPKFKSRVLDAMKRAYIPYEAYKVRPYKTLKRYGEKSKKKPDL